MPHSDDPLTGYYCYMFEPAGSAWADALNQMAYAQCAQFTFETALFRLVGEGSLRRYPLRSMRHQRAQIRSRRSSVGLPRPRIPSPR
ncbi:hypothetical protein JDV02_003105 [Purpureocillium takamizusanense]|uniref:Uncharacterized protein n=1 Tax=Purpureocillium takamizusanense TaxID=2060973 RepID=A0A9Q8QCJ1_9HYPO|nr:uncharacterized protein JDV02_003105 [Purpureocillium takamizusanense]UNI16691.1 hypothetical protein JDV02_003105 [Purpureocillium takamizusanense]